MNLQFTIIFTKNKYLGTTLVPVFLTTKNDNYSTIENISFNDNNIKQLTNQQRIIVSKYLEISEKSIFKVFGKKNQNLVDFLHKIEPIFFTTHIKPYIDKRLIEILYLAHSYNILIYKKQTINIFKEDEILIKLPEVHSKFNFTYNNENLEYDLHLEYNNTRLRLKDKHVHIISNNPSAILIDNNIYLIKNLDSKKIIPFVSKDKIIIPTKFTEQYFKTFVYESIKKFETTTKGFNLINSKETPTAILSTEPTFTSELGIVLKFIYGTTNISRNESSESIVKYNSESHEFTKIYRDKIFEKQSKELLISMGLSQYSDTVFNTKPETKYAVINWLTTNIDTLKENKFELQIDNIEKFYLGKINIECSINEKVDWFDINVTINVNGFHIPLVKLRKNILSETREYELPDGKVMLIPEEWFSKYYDLFTIGEKEENNIKIKKHYFSLLTKLSDKTNTIQNFENLINNKQTYSLSDTINANLRDYQKIGFDWLMKLRDNSFGGCLADDMGLGKTIQTLSLLQTHHKNSEKKLSKNKTNNNAQLSIFNEIEDSFVKNATSLIITPSSLTHNWKNEIAKFTPNLKLKTYIGQERIQNAENFKYFDIILTTYGIIRNDFELIKKFEFDYIVADESQYIKNPQSGIYKAMIQLECKHKLILTGTPIENSLIDLWSQLNFINPGLLNTKSWFVNNYVNEIEKNKNQEKSDKLRMLTSPFILRRTKSEVAKDLPPLTEQIIMCEMDNTQAKIYNSKKHSIQNLILGTYSNVSTIKQNQIVLNALSELRQIANHPKMLDTKYKGDSGKLEIVVNHIKNIIKEDHKVLIFSSYVKHLNIIEEVCNENNWKYSKLTGQTTKRESVINYFQKSPDNKIFLISLKAGGVGLNLTSADYVLILDPWWNPAAEQQAISRAHRIGQNKKVFVYRYITKATIEEKILKLQENKKRIAKEIISDSTILKQLTKNQIIELFN